MIRTTFQKLLTKTGKSYKIDAKIPASLIWRTIFRRLIMLIRGVVYTGSKVYIGAGCTILNVRNIQFGKNVTIDRHTIIDGYAKRKIVLGDCVKIGAFSNLSCTSHLSKYGEGITIGNHSAVGDYTQFGAAGGIQIGNDVIMGSYISFHSENHNFEQKGVLIREQGVTSKGIKIGNNIWVGAKVTFLDGCHVGNNSVVAAGAVVNGHYPDNSLIGGVPAKVLKTL